MDERQAQLNKVMLLEEIEELDSSLRTLSQSIVTYGENAPGTKNWIDRVRRDYLDLESHLRRVRPVQR